MTSLAALAAAPRRRLSWAGSVNPDGGMLWTTPGGALAGGTGQVPFDVTDPAGAVPTSYTFQGSPVAALSGDAAVVGLEFFGFASRHRAALIDLMWISAGYTAASAATVNSPTLPARDANGSTNGEGCVLVGWFATNMNATVSYTNSDGTSGRSTSLPANGSGGPHIFPLDAGDKGVRSVQTITPSSTGLCRFAIVRRVAATTSRFAATVAIPDDAVTSRLHNVSTLKAGTLLFPEFGYMGVALIRECGCYVDLAML